MKKRSILKILLIITAIFFSTTNVFAYNDEEFLNKYVEDKTTVLLCEYKDNENNVQNRIYYMFNAPNSTGQAGPWAYLYRLSGSLIPMS